MLTQTQNRDDTSLLNQFLLNPKPLFSLVIMLYLNLKWSNREIIFGLWMVHLEKTKRIWSKKKICKSFLVLSIANWFLVELWILGRPLVISDFQWMLVQFNMEYLSSIKKYLISVIQDWRLLGISLEMFFGMPLTIADIVPTISFYAANELPKMGSPTLGSILGKN